MITLDDISTAVIALIRVGAVFRFIYCMVRLQGAEEEQTQFKKRAKNTVLFYVLAESIWQIKDIVFYGPLASAHAFIISFWPLGTAILMRSYALALYFALLSFDVLPPMLKTSFKYMILNYSEKKHT